MSNPYEWHVVSDSEGFYIEDEYGEEVLPYYLRHHINPAGGPPTGWRCTDYKVAQRVCNETIQHAIDNAERHNWPGWEGGFADNH